ncbi:MAG: D-hexose-6-phosphate mutarotase [Planctomycetota bacterium]|nr:MAG: D-hexose-6-phosphate mutarotase [Planctomycetota bacterium]
MSFAPPCASSLAIDCIAAGKLYTCIMSLPDDAIAIADHVIWEQGPGGLRQLRLCSAAGSAVVTLHGAHVTEFAPAGMASLLWLSGQSHWQVGKAIRGGIPLCWPWFGPWSGPDERPAHGFARICEWQPVASALLADGRVRLDLRLPIPPAYAQWLTAGVGAELSIIVGAELELSLQTVHSGSEPVALSDALHSYFTVGDVHQVAVDGLDGCTYVDQCAQGALRVQDGAVTFRAETDRVYADRGPSTVLRDGSTGRRIRISKSGSGSTVVWNPWVAKAQRMADFADDEWPSMVCVETANCLDNRFLLLPGNRHHTTLRIACEQE